MRISTLLFGLLSACTGAIGEEVSVRPVEHDAGIAEWSCRRSGTGEFYDPSCDFELISYVDLSGGSAMDASATDASSPPDAAPPLETIPTSGIDHDCNGISTDGPICRPRLYVDRRARGANDGGSWHDAYVDLQAALDDASACEDGAEIWVREGTYVPTRRRIASTPRTETFVARGIVRVLGGFAGTETDASARRPIAHVTVLSGDLGAPGSRTDNAFTVLTIAECPITSLTLDGVTVAEGEGPSDARGLPATGAFVRGGFDHVFREVLFTRNTGVDATAAWVEGALGTTRFVSSVFEDNGSRASTPGAGGSAGLTVFGDVAVDGCSFSHNRSDELAGGAFLAQGVVTVRDTVFFENESQRGMAGLSVRSGRLVRIERCRFEGNTTPVTGMGGTGLELDAGAAGALVSDSVFVRNEGFSAGALSIGASSPLVRIERCRLLGNTSRSYGGAMHAYGGGVTVNHTLFSGNQGSGITFLRSSPEARLHVTNSTFAFNRAPSGAAVYGLSAAGSAPIQIDGSILWDDRPGATEESQLVSQGTGAAGFVVARSIVAGSAGRSTVWTADPLFVDALGADDIAGTLDDNTRLRAGSPAVDIGEASSMASDSFDTDFDGDDTEHAPYDLDTDPSIVGVAPDLGAYEHH